MKLSIIVICLNEERHLARCLKALTEPHRGVTVELIVVDGGSTDRSREIALSYGARVLDSPKGIPVQRNVGARAATGDILAYVDADVEILEGWFSTVARHFRDSHYKILGCPPRLPKDASWIARTYALHWGMGSNGSKSNFNPNDDRVLSTQSLVLGREVFRELGGFQEHLGVDEDTFFLLEARKQGVPIICDTRLAYIHHGEPETLRDFFRRIRWGTNCGAWYRLILRGDGALAKRRQYLYGAAIAAEVGLLGLSVLAAVAWGWLSAMPFSIGLLAVSCLFPAVRTAIRHRSLKKIGQLCLMYGAFGLATASVMAGLGWNKSKRWR